MTQAIGAISFRDVKIETSPDGVVWTDRSGWTNGITVGGGARLIGKFFTADGDTPILTGGKRDELTVAVKAAYTEGATDIEEVVRAAYETPGTMLYVRWHPKYTGAGSFGYVTSAGIVTTPPYPHGTVDKPDPVTVDFTVAVASITKVVG